MGPLLFLAPFPDSCHFLQPHQTCYGLNIKIPEFEFRGDLVIFARLVKTRWKLYSCSVKYLVNT